MTSATISTMSLLRTARRRKTRIFRRCIVTAIPTRATTCPVSLCSTWQAAWPSTSGFCFWLGAVGARPSDRESGRRAGEVERGVDVTLFASLDSETTAKLDGVCPRPYNEDASLDGRVWEAIHIAYCLGRSAEFDLVHNNLDWLPLAGDERVLDAGCGTGRVTELLAARLPRGHVVALDASASMVEAARGRLAPFGDRVEFVVADLARPLPLSEPGDAILSTATFHWLPDHDVLFANLAAVLRPAGWLVAQCGGAGNIASIHRVLAGIGDGWLGATYYATPLDTARRLEAAGFVDVECWLTDEPTRFEPGEPFETFLRTVILGPQVDRLPEDARGAYVHDVATRLGEPVVDYVRLNVDARRA